MKCRKNVKNLTADEIRDFVDACELLKSTDSILHPGSQSRYDDFVETHLLSMYDFSINDDRDPSWAHGGSIFFPWHRELLYRFEKLLQSVAGNPNIMIPYWDWTREQDIGDDGFPFKHPFLGVDGDDADGDRVKKEAGASSPYPYPFDPEQWSTSIEVNDPGDSLTYFQRAFGEFGNAPNLPENDSTVTGVGTSYRNAILSSINYLTCRARSEDIHNLVHRWVGGNMLRMTSPNDPVFFLHHAAIDRMWSIWQEKVSSGTPLYVASDTDPGHKPDDAMLFNEAGDPAPFTTGATPNQVINGHTMHGDGVWYDTDIPEIDTPDPLLEFIDIPEGLTSYKAVKFRIKGCRQVHFRITAEPTGNFGTTSMGTEFTADPVESDDYFYGYVWVQVQSVAGTIPDSSVNIQAYIIDNEGYYAASEGGEYPIGDYSVNLSATSVPRENNAIALVLDRSGSMSSPAGGSSTRVQLLENAIGVFRALMQSNDEVAVVTFDDVVATPIAMQPVNGAPDFSTIDLTPRNTTWIGGGIQSGAAELATASHTNKSVLVLTDGNENVHPYIHELPSGTVTDRTFAIGFGLPGQVSDAALQDITSNTNGDLIITGNISTEEQRFNLTKYFVQILAGATSSQVVLDPNGKLSFGTKDVIPFYMTESDVYVDIISLCPVPRFLDFILETPDGTIISASTVAPNVQYIVDKNVAFYRLNLPALAGNPEGSHSGEWKAILSLVDEERIKKLLANKEFANQGISPPVRGALPYSLIVHATSNIQMKAWIIRDTFNPGNPVQVFARLNAYDVPLQSYASLWAEITDPDRNTSELRLEKDSDGIYSGSFTTRLTGVYQIKVKADGYSSEGAKFTREKTLTAGVFNERLRQGSYGGTDEHLCSLIECILRNGKVFDEALIKHLADKGFHVNHIMDCLRRICPEQPREQMTTLKDKKKISGRFSKQTISNVKLVKSREPKQVKHVPRDPGKAARILEARKMEVHTMFKQLDLKKEEKRSPSKKGKDSSITGRKKR